MSVCIRQDKVFVVEAVDIWRYLVSSSKCTPSICTPSILVVLVMTTYLYTL